MRHPLCHRGFSLIELMVVVGIMAVVMALGVPSFQTWIRNVQIRNATESIHAGMQIARQEALRRNLNVSLWLVAGTNPKIMDETCALSSTSSSWVVSVDDPSAACGSAPSETTAPRIVQTYAAGNSNSSVTVAVTPADANRVTFNGFGQLVSGSNVITQIDVTSADNPTNTRKLRILISNGGSTRSCDPAVTASTDPRKC